MFPYQKHFNYYGKVFEKGREVYQLLERVGSRENVAHGL